jgi:hypothetical protein
MLYSYLRNYNAAIDQSSLNTTIPTINRLHVLACDCFLLPSVKECLNRGCERLGCYRSRSLRLALQLVVAVKCGLLIGAKIVTRTSAWLQTKRDYPRETTDGGGEP